VVGRHDRQLVHAQALPQIGVVIVVVVLRADRRRAHELRTFEPGAREVVFERHVEVLRAGLGEHVEPFVLRGSHLVECVGGRHVHDVERHVAGDFRQHDRAVRRLAFEQARARIRVVLRVGLAARQVLLHEHVDGDAVLGVHHDHRAVLRGGLHGAKNLSVIAVEDARVGHEQLETGDALVVDEIRHVFQRLLVDAADDLVERVVDRAVAAGFAVPFGQAQLHVLVVSLQRHVDDGGHAAPRRGDGASLERVDGRGAAEGQLHVRVHVDAAGHHILPLRVDHLVGGHAHRVGLSARVERGDDLAVDEHVLFVATGRADDGAVLDERAGHVGLLLLSLFSGGRVRGRRRVGGRGRTPSGRAPS